MGTGDDIVLEGGELDGGLGRTFVFSSPDTCGAGVKLGNINNDNSRKITESRDLSQIFGSCVTIYIILHFLSKGARRNENVNEFFPKISNNCFLDLHMQVMVTKARQNAQFIEKLQSSSIQPLFKPNLFQHFSLKVMSLVKRLEAIGGDPNDK